MVKRNNPRRQPMLKAFLIAIVPLSFFLGCASLVPVETTMPSEIDMAGLHTIAVLPFTYPALDHGSAAMETSIRYAADLALDRPTDRHREQQDVARYATDHFIGLLENTGHFTIVDLQTILQAAAKTENAGLSPQELGRALGVDALITGSITHMTAKEHEESIAINDKYGNTSSSSIFWKRAEIQVDYSVLDIKTNRRVGTRSFKGDQTLSADRVPLFPSDQKMIQEILDRILSPVPRQLAPFTVTENRALLADATNDPEMKKLIRLVDKKMYSEALDGYLKIWSSTHNVAAGYNAAILREASGDIDGAVSLMSEVAASTHNQKALKEADRLKNTKSEREAAAAEM
jgi:hypothetical protein